MSADKPHERFSAQATFYLRNLDPEDLQAEAIAVHYQDPPRPSESGGTTISLRFPALIVAHYVAEGGAVAEKVARILNAHWDDE